MNKFIKKTSPDFKQIFDWLNQAEKDLLIAKKLLLLDPKWSLTIAYQAMLRTGRALMFISGCLPSAYRQHKTVVEYTAKKLGPKFLSVTNQFERLRRKRHDFFYGNLIGISQSEVEQSLKTGKILLRQVKSLAQKKNPQNKLL